MERSRELAAALSALVLASCVAVADPPALERDRGAASKPLPLPDAWTREPIPDAPPSEAAGETSETPPPHHSEGGGG